MKHVVKYDVYLDILLMVYVIHVCLMKTMTIQQHIMFSIYGLGGGNPRLIAIDSDAWIRFPLALLLAPVALQL